ncbi:MAG: heme exporter protein CcmB [Methylophilales bacterium RIFCSPHIGHO2_02_FULL_57_10]|nr:MAG: heme exporter protein CcmB [Methylophilales bacterium RIFCSPHIGHO2_02_FULL_57_10]
MSRQSIWMGLLRRDLLLAARRSADVVSVLFFFIIAASLFPLGVGADPALLRAVAPGVLWVAALLSTMLSLGRLFAADLADGTLEQMLLSPQPLVMTVAIKTLAHWLVSGVPLVFLAPVLGLQFDLAGREIAVLTASLLLGTPVLSLIGAIGAALTLGVRGGNVLVAVLVLPLYIPVLIFGAGAVTASAAGLSAQAGLSLVGAMLALSVVFAPYAAAAALRIAME